MYSFIVVHRFVVYRLAAGEEMLDISDRRYKPVESNTRSANSRLEDLQILISILGCENTPHFWVSAFCLCNNNGQNWAEGFSKMINTYLSFLMKQRLD